MGQNFLVVVYVDPLSTVLKEDPVKGPKGPCGDI